MRAFVPALTLLAGITAMPAFAQAQPNEPTRQEIEEAYRSKSSGGNLPGIHIERWRVKQIRGWEIHFKRISAKKTDGVRKTTYDARAKKNGSSALYLVTETMAPMGMPTPNMRWPIVVVEPKGLMSCP
jgi:hypothetical protein